MSWGSVTIRVRPLRVAFIVDPADRKGLYRAVELSTVMWGGAYNPIIPAYRRTPPEWEAHRMRRLPSPAAIVEGYLNGFDPDLVVTVGRCAKRPFHVGNRELVKEEDLIGDITKSGAPRYGVGFPEVLSDFVRKELKYERTDALKVVLTKPARQHKLFLASVFGALPESCWQIFERHFKNTPRVTTAHASLATYADLLAPETLFPRRLTYWTLEERPFQESQLFICDATSLQDAIDYWNLRAAGYNVVPIALQAAHQENVKKLSKEFIEENFRPYRNNPEMYYDTTIQRARSVSEELVKSFVESLDVKKPADKRWHKYTIRTWYPRLWESWAREHTSEGIGFPWSHEEERRLADGETRLELRSLDPKIELFREFSNAPRFANDFSFRFYGTKEAMAEVFPEGSRELSSAIGRTGYRNWRFSRLGPTFLAHNCSDLIFLDVPRAEAVVREWLRERGWEVTLSAPGRIATQLLKQLGGSFGTTWLAHKGVIDLLRDLEKEAGLPRQAVVGRLTQVIKEDELLFDADRFLDGLLEANALRLGAKVQCPVCTRHNWFELNRLGYQLECKFCLSEFGPPVRSPREIEWTYRAHGPFAGSIAQGSFTVLLTLSFLGGNHDRGVTPLFSYEARKAGRVLEADLTCLYKRTTWRDTPVRVVHAECKSFNEFELRDVKRMRDLASEFPGCVLVFSTLNEALTRAESEMIGKLVRAERSKRLRGKTYSPVVVLTGIELFSRGFGDCWKGRAGLYEELQKGYFDFGDLDALADATGRLYLSLPSFYKWSEEQRQKRRTKRMMKSGAL